MLWLLFLFTVATATIPDLIFQVPPSDTVHAHRHYPFFYGIEGTASWHDSLYAVVAPSHIHVSSFWACSGHFQQHAQRNSPAEHDILQGTSQTDTLVRFYDQAGCQGESSYVQFQGDLCRTFGNNVAVYFQWRSVLVPPRSTATFRTASSNLQCRSDSGLRHGGVDLGQLGGPTVVPCPPKCDDVRLPCPIDPSPCLHLYGKGRLVPRPVLRRHLATKCDHAPQRVPPPQVFARAPQRALPLDGQHVALHHLVRPAPLRPRVGAKQWQNWTIQSCPRSRSSPWRTTTPPWKPSSFAKWHGSSTTTVPSRRWSPTTLVI